MLVWMILLIVGMIISILSYRKYKKYKMDKGGGGLIYLTITVAGVILCIAMFLLLVATVWLVWAVSL